MQCPIDGCDFESGEHGVKVHCGQSHPVEENPYRIECECNYCGDEFTLKKSRYEDEGGKFCSQTCQGQAKKSRKSQIVSEKESGVSYECTVDECNREFDTEHGMKIHRSTKHNVYVSDNDDSKSIIMCECENCGEEFKVQKQDYENGRGKYCSRSCQFANGRTDIDKESHMIEYTCDYCGEKSKILSKESRHGHKQKYCSQKCYHKHKIEKNRVECECNCCGDKFFVKKRDHKKGWNGYCSMECRSEDRNVDCECDYCGDKITVNKARYDKYNNHYCSQKCFGLDNRSSNPDIRNSPEYRQFRERVLERDNHRCVECGDDDDLHVHHITPIYEDESLATDVDNGQTLCVECHAVAHEELGDDDLAALIRSKADDEFEIAVTV